MKRCKYITVVVLALLLLPACAPERQQLKTETNPQVDQFLIKSLALNKWCQQNPTTGVSEYKWQFNPDLTATSTQLSSQAQESFRWSITTDNTITITMGMITVIFIKKISYGYNVAEHKRTMLWSDDTPEVTKFIECN